MKSKEAGSPGLGRRPLRGGMDAIRMEWMDPMSWRLPSGRALAEFALQSGFLAPLMLVGPRFKKPKKAAGTLGKAAGVEKRLEEAPGSSGGFRETGFRETK